MYKTETDYEENLVVKLFAICSFNYYVHVFYVAFLKGRLEKEAFEIFTYYRLSLIAQSI